MNDFLLLDLERTFKKCSDCALHPEYSALLRKLDNMMLTQELVDYLCEKATSKKHIWEMGFEHLRVLLLHPSVKAFDLKAFYFENLQTCRRLAMKIFYIRGYAIYASEEELNPVMEKFRKNLEKNHDYIDYNYILSVAGIPYLVNTYRYDCFVKTFEKAVEEYERINPLLRGYFTLNTNLEQVDLLPPEEIRRRSELFLENRQNKD